MLTKYFDKRFAFSANFQIEYGRFKANEVKEAGVREFDDSMDHFKREF